MKTNERKYSKSKSLRQGRPREIQSVVFCQNTQSINTTRNGSLSVTTLNREDDFSVDNLTLYKINYARNKKKK